MPGRKKSISAAIDALAALYEYGALECAADPAGFVERVVADVTALRAQSAALLDATERAEKAEAECLAWMDDAMDVREALDKANGRGTTAAVEATAELHQRRLEQALARAEKAESEVAGLRKAVATADVDVEATKRLIAFFDAPEGDQGPEDKVADAVRISLCDHRIARAEVKS